MKRNVCKALENEDFPMLEQFIKSGEFEVNRVVKRFPTELTRACRCKRTKMVKFLLQHGADPNLRDGHDDYPITVCAEYEFGHCVKIAQMLLDAGADINSQDRFGNTLAHNAVSSHHYETLKFCLANKADITISNEDGKIPLDIAFSHKNNPHDSVKQMFAVLTDHYSTTYGSKDSNTCRLRDICNQLADKVYVRPTIINK
jgi:ankyrin repeat protein